MPIPIEINVGKNTSHHDHVITLHNFKITKATVNAFARPANVPIELLLSLTIIIPFFILYFFFDTLGIPSMYRILRYFRLFLQPVYLTALDQLLCRNDSNALMCPLILLFSYYLSNIMPCSCLIYFFNVSISSSRLRAPSIYA